MARKVSNLHHSTANSTKTTTKNNNSSTINTNNSSTKSNNHTKNTSSNNKPTGENVHVETIDVDIASAKTAVDDAVTEKGDTVLAERLVLSDDPKDWREVSASSKTCSAVARLEPIAEEGDLGGPSSPRLKLSVDDVKDEIAYWNLAIYGYVMGANPPREVLDNFLRRIWSAYDITQISFLPNGLFVVRFAKSEHHKLVLANGMFLFDGKPLIVKPWDPTVRISKVSVKKVPIWVKLVGLDLKFWGAKCLEKLAGLVVTPRLMVEVEIDQNFPNQIIFEDEVGSEVHVAVEYDWLPITCQKCKGIGHNTQNCRRKALDTRRPAVAQPMKQVWKPKTVGTAAPVDLKEYPLLVKEKPNPVVVATLVVTPAPSHGPIYTPARVITKLTRHETRVVSGQDTEFNTTFNTELAEAEKTNEMKNIKWFLHHNDVDLFGLLETRVKPGSLNKVTNNVCYGWKYVTNTSMHPGGRIWILWKGRKVDLEVLEMASQYIHAKVKVLQSGVTFTSTFVYAFNKLEDRLGKLVKDNEMAPFLSAVNNCGLQDMKTTGAFFTWNNKQASATRVFSRIDRVLVNGDWLKDWSDWFAHYQPEGEFDHCPCIVSCGDRSSGTKKPFKFFNMWTKVEDFGTLVTQHWQMQIQGTPMFRMVRKLKLLKPSLKKLNRDLFSDIERNADVAYNLLLDCQQQLQGDITNTQLMDKEKQIRESYHLLDDARTAYLRQKAKFAWVHDGDANTHMFHQAIKQRQIHNKVLQIENMDGVECRDPNDILQAFVDYYKSLLGAKAQTSCFYKNVVTQGKVISEGDWDGLCKIPTEEEIRLALFDIPDDKTPGPDGYTSCFFKASWSTVKDDMCLAVKDFFTTGMMLKQLNSIVHTLIPKVDNPRSVKEFRPIACCNTLYKVISKIICTRISGCLPQIINPAQCAFIKGRSILGNILISQDLFRLYTRKSVSPRCLMKVNLRKAYDSIEWIFVEQMLDAMHFPPHLIKLIMQCVSTTSYSISLNGQIHGYFPGCRGLRQGDPMSPLLFTLCMEYLSRLLEMGSWIPGFHFHPLCKKLRLTHLMFVDDLLLFCKGEVKSICIIMELFKRFSSASGLHINSEKSDFYSNGMSIATVDKILQGTGFKKGDLPFKYLGVKISHKRLTKMDCNVLVDRMISRIRGWNSRKISYAGRLVLVKSALSTIHNYWSQIFVLPVGVMDRIKALCRNFLWEGSDKYSKAPLVAWNVLCQSKETGGLGLIDSKIWNVAAIDYEPSSYSSWAWRKICEVKHTMKNGYVNGKRRGTNEAYTISDGYKWLMQCTAVKQQQRLLTLDRLTKMGVAVPTECFICGMAPETHEHLFSGCVYAQSCYQILANWLGVNVTELCSCEKLLHLKKISLLARQVIIAAVAGLIYGIWHCRNVCRLDGYVTQPGRLIQQIQADCKSRVLGVFQGPMALADRNWCHGVGIC
ncbi:uncharacterized protein LOC141590406 [Silene latifolia]|uniref:uncharacterized protein LOC141590406 n=1 Tax=Silene latifolia TaxID=37657 RepID=UPI003D77E8B8